MSLFHNIKVHFRSIVKGILAIITASTRTGIFSLFMRILLIFLNFSWYLYIVYTYHLVKTGLGHRFLNLVASFCQKAMCWLVATCNVIFGMGITIDSIRSCID